MSNLEKFIAQGGPEGRTISGRDFYRRHVEMPAYNNLKRWRWDNVMALDISKGDDSFSQHLAKQGVKPEAITRVSSGLSRVVKLNNLATGFQPGSFDIVAADGTFNHMGNRQLKSTIGRLSELMKVNAQLMFVGPNPEVYREVPRGYLRVRQQMHMHMWERFNPEYVDMIKQIAPSLGLSYVESPSLLAPRYNPDPNAELQYWPYGTPSMRMAGLLFKPPVHLESQHVQLQLEAGSFAEIEASAMPKLIGAVAA